MARHFVLPGPAAAIFAPEGRENEECAHLDYVGAQIIQDAVFGVVSYFLSDSFIGHNLFCSSDVTHFQA